MSSWQESQAVALSNINSVMTEVNSGKMARRLHLQEEFPAGTSETTSDSGLAILLKQLQACTLKICF